MSATPVENSFDRPRCEQLVPKSFGYEACWWIPAGMLVSVWWEAFFFVCGQQLKQPNLKLNQKDKIVDVSNFTNVTSVDEFNIKGKLLDQLAILNGFDWIEMWIS
jgi:hypothetical protein